MTAKFLGILPFIFLVPIMLVGQDSKVNLKAEEAAVRAVIVSRFRTLIQR